MKNYTFGRRHRLKMADGSSLALTGKTIATKAIGLTTVSQTYSLLGLAKRGWQLARV